MSTTPEGKVKEKIDAILDKYYVFYHKPVQFGVGSDDTLDYFCVVRVGDTPIAFFIEAKKQGEQLTERQDQLAAKLRRDYRCNVFIIDGPYGYNQLETWLTKISKAVSDDDTRKRVQAQY